MKQLLLVHMQEADLMCTLPNRLCKCSKEEIHPPTTTRPVHSLLCTLPSCQVFLFLLHISVGEVFLVFVSVQTVPVVDAGGGGTCAALCGRSTSVSVHVKYCLLYVEKNEFLLNLVLSCSHCRCDYRFLFLHNRESGKLRRSDLNENETAFTSASTETRGERSLIQKRVIV